MILPIALLISFIRSTEVSLKYDENTAIKDCAFFNNISSFISVEKVDDKSEEFKVKFTKKPSSLKICKYALYPLVSLGADFEDKGAFKMFEFKNGDKSDYIALIVAHDSNTDSIWYRHTEDEYIIGGLLNGLPCNFKAIKNNDNLIIKISESVGLQVDLEDQESIDILTNATAKYVNFGKQNISNVFFESSDFLPLSKLIINENKGMSLKKKLVIATIILILVALVIIAVTLLHKRSKAPTN